MPLQDGSGQISPDYLASRRVDLLHLAEQIGRSACEQLYSLSSYARTVNLNGLVSKPR